MDYRQLALVSIPFAMDYRVR